jgi:hypothetical protein
VVSTNYQTLYRAEPGPYMVMLAVRAKEANLLESFDSTGQGREAMEKTLGTLQVNITDSNGHQPKGEPRTYDVNALHFSTAKGFVKHMANKYCH